jgi:hypothetical protein
MTTTWYETPPRRKLPTWAKVLITLVLVCVVGLALFVAAVVVSLSGGLDDVLDVGKPTEDSRKVEKARDRAVPTVERQHAAVVRGLPGEDTGIRVSDDACDQGQHNWKVDDDYDLDCVLSRGTVLHVQGPLGAGDLTAAVAARLTGWVQEQPSYDLRARPRWTFGGAADGQAGVLEVALLEVPPGEVSFYDLGSSADPSTVTRDGRPYALDRVRQDFPGTLVVVRTSERYFYE